MCLVSAGWPPGGSSRVRPRAPRWRRDILYSLSSAIIFALVGLLSAQLFAHGWTKLYLRIDRFGWTYLWFSLLAMIVCTTRGFTGRTA